LCVKVTLLRYSVFPAESEYQNRELKTFVKNQGQRLCILIYLLHGAESFLRS
jgi:hypothetical protein